MVNSNSRRSLKGANLLRPGTRIVFPMTSVSPEGLGETSKELPSYETSTLHRPQVNRFDRNVEYDFRITKS